MSIPFLDLKAAVVELRSEIDTAIARVLDSGQYILGDEVEAFEIEYAKYCGAQYCVGVANGLDALHLVLRAWGIGPGDEVIIPSNTYIATWLAISYCGATPIPVEPDEKTYNINPLKIEAHITNRTRAIIPVHLYGQPADLDYIKLISKTHNLKLLEDGAQAHGAKYKGRRIGGHGNTVAWSFYPGKNLGAIGDGGAITTDDGELFERLKSLRNYGSSKKYIHELIGFNSRLDPIQAAILNVKLERLDEWNGIRKKIASVYCDQLKNLELIMPFVPSWADPVWHLFVVRTNMRENLQKYLADLNITTSIHYPVPPHLQSAYLGLIDGGKNFPIAEKMAKDVLSLPIGPHMSDLEIKLIICALRNFHQ